jgi:hypothetical protein
VFSYYSGHAKILLKDLQLRGCPAAALCDLGPDGRCPGLGEAGADRGFAGTQAAYRAVVNRPGGMVRTRKWTARARPCTQVRGYPTPALGPASGRQPDRRRWSESVHCWTT